MGFLCVLWDVAIVADNVRKLNKIVIERTIGMSIEVIANGAIQEYDACHDNSNKN